MLTSCKVVGRTFSKTFSTGFKLNVCKEWKRLMESRHDNQLNKMTNIWASTLNFWENFEDISFTLISYNFPGSNITISSIHRWQKFFLFFSTSSAFTDMLMMCFSSWSIFFLLLSIFFDDDTLQVLIYKSQVEDIKVFIKLTISMESLSLFIDAFLWLQN